jgi:hypothetical protein
MKWNIRDWRPRELFISWGVYWAGLAVAVLPGPLLAAWRATQAGQRGEMSGALSLERVTITITLHEITTYAASVPNWQVALVALGPPILLALLWAVRVRRAGEVLPTAAAPAPLSPGAAAPVAPVRRESRHPTPV